MVTSEVVRQVVCVRTWNRCPPERIDIIIPVVIVIFASPIQIGFVTFKVSTLFTPLIIQWMSAPCIDTVIASVTVNDERGDIVSTRVLVRIVEIIPRTTNGRRASSIVIMFVNADVATHTVILIILRKKICDLNKTMMKQRTILLVAVVVFALYMFWSRRREYAGDKQGVIQFIRTNSASSGFIIIAKMKEMGIPVNDEHTKNIIRLSKNKDDVIDYITNKM